MWWGLFLCSVILWLEKQNCMSLSRSQSSKSFHPLHQHHYSSGRNTAASTPACSHSLSLSDGLTGFFAEECSLQLKSYISVWKRSRLKRGRSKDEETLTDRRHRNLALAQSLDQSHGLIFFTEVLYDVSAGCSVRVVRLESGNFDRWIGIHTEYHTSQNSASQQ